MKWKTLISAFGSLSAYSHQGQPSWEIWFLCSQGLVKLATANGWKWNQPPAEGVEDSMSWSRGKDGRALLHHLSRNLAEMFQSLKIIEAKTVPFFSLASCFSPCILETHYPLRGSSTRRNETFFKSPLWMFAMQTNNLESHCTFSQETKGTPCARYLLFLSFVSL